MSKACGKIDWLASYPKSGNTWMRLLLANYFGEGDEPHDFNKPGVTNGIASLRWRFDESLGLPSSDLTTDEVLSLQSHVYETLAEQDPQHHWMKVHDAPKQLSDGSWLFPPAASGVVIYLIRNPLDVAVSLAFHDGHADMQRAVAKLCDRRGSLASGRSPHLRQHLGSWSEHVESWIDQADIPVLIVRYEDMLADTGRELTRVIKFARPGLDIDEVRIAKAVSHTSFEKLKAAEDARPFRETPLRAKRFFREGKAGDWRQHLSPSQVRQVIDHHAQVMARFGYESLEAAA